VLQLYEMPFSENCVFFWYDPAVIWPVI